MPKQVSYLGAGVYIRTGSYAGEVVIYTSDGLHETNRIVLGPDELFALDSFLNRCGVKQVG